MTLEDRIGLIASMSMAQKRQEWRRIFRSPPPPAFGAGLLGRAIACHLQEKEYGGLSKSEIRRLTKSIEGARPLKSAPLASLLEPGTVLMRTWHGDVHRVLVERGGFLYKGHTYSSLSLIAKMITGTAWSGPRFFGLKSPRLKHESAER